MYRDQKTLDNARKKQELLASDITELARNRVLQHIAEDFIDFLFLCYDEGRPVKEWLSEKDRLYIDASLKAFEAFAKLDEIRDENT